MGSGIPPIQRRRNLSEGYWQPPTPLICLGLNISFSFQALPHIENLREFWIRILTKSPIYSRLSQDKKTFLAVQLTKRLLHDCVLHRTTWYVLFSASLGDGCSDLSEWKVQKGWKTQSEDPSLQELWCISCLQCCLLLFLFGRTDAGKQKSSISNSSLLQCSLIQLFTNKILSDTPGLFCKYSISTNSFKADARTLLHIKLSWQVWGVFIIQVSICFTQMGVTNSWWCHRGKWESHPKKNR